MELDAKSTETNMVLVHDKILMSLMGANGIKPVHIFTTGWPGEPPDFRRETYLAYKQTDQVKKILNTFENRGVTVNLDKYLDSAQELQNYLGEMVYWPAKK